MEVIFFNVLELSTQFATLISPIYLMFRIENLKENKGRGEVGSEKEGVWYFRLISGKISRKGGVVYSLVVRKLKFSLLIWGRLLEGGVWIFNPHLGYFTILTNTQTRLIIVKLFSNWQNRGEGWGIFSEFLRGIYHIILYKLSVL